MRKITNPSFEIPVPGLEEYYSDFLSSRKKELYSLIVSLNAGDYQALKERIHEWKGYAAPYGFQELEILAKKLEPHVLNFEYENCHEVLREVKDYLGHS